MQLRKWVRASLLIIASTVVVATLMGAIFERRARARAWRESPLIGRLVDLGDGRRLQLDCRGSGAPTVVLESGLDNYGALSWSAVHDSIAATTRTCAYSRAGIMWSDPAPGAFDSQRNSRDLHTALAIAGESAPWVMVGHSIGAAYVMRFSQSYPTEVEGVVLVDGSHPDQFARYFDATGRSLAPSATIPRIGASLAWTGVLRALPKVDSTQGWSSVVASAASGYLPTSLNALAQEALAIPATLSQMGEMRLLGNRPLMVLAAGQGPSAADLVAMRLTPDQGRKLEEVSRALRVDQATWSERGSVKEISDASHYIQFDRPDVVTAAVREVVQSVRTRVSSCTNQPAERACIAETK